MGSLRPPPQPPSLGPVAAHQYGSPSHCRSIRHVVRPEPPRHRGRGRTRLLAPHFHVSDDAHALRRRRPARSAITCPCRRHPFLPHLSASGKKVTEHDRAYARQIQPLLIRIDRHLRALQRLNDRANSGTSTNDEHGPRQRATEYGITPRELTVLSLLAEGLTAASIAQRLSISVRIVNTHLEHLYRKLGTSNRLTTVLVAREAALV
ncbi:helix-turn-helix transcriptional regulator [Streptomyces flaveus]|uniref:helix-turn-helix transcriptional regulator n=1 Tax=Streptomyces flaveus TaxID=66370 RepID=UPI002483DEFB|nr:LuxR family transcriptional regulator [Streptomyces flaveus]